MNGGIFVSYSHKDYETVEKIVSVIRESSEENVLFDHRQSDEEKLFSVIANQILNNEYFVFVVSSDSMASDWCLHEFEFAASENKKIIAIWIEDVRVSPQFKPVFYAYHINWYSLTDKLFADAIERVFKGYGHISHNFLSLQAKLSFNEQRYFHTKEDLKNLEELK